MIVRFVVEGLPPKKDGTNSMWRKPAEVERLRRLRAAAHRALGGRPPYDREVELALRIYAEPFDGHLDNFITGVCDGLMAANRAIPIDPTGWPDAIAPYRSVALTDDRRVQRIAAERLPPGEEGPRYEVELHALVAPASFSPPAPAAGSDAPDVAEAAGTLRRSASSRPSS